MSIPTMRTIHWLFVVSLALFVSGVGFVIAGARTARRAPAAATPAIVVTPVASVKQIMKGIVGPAANTVFNSVSTTVTKAGVEEVAPHTDQEWEALGNTAAAKRTASAKAVPAAVDPELGKIGAHA